MGKIADYFNVTIDYIFGRVDTPNPIEKITQSVSDDPELLAFWSELKQREDLQLLIRQIKDKSPEEIKKIIRVVKAMEAQNEGKAALRSRKHEFRRDRKAHNTSD